MLSENPREDILKKVRQALGKGDYVLNVPELASPVLKPLEKEDLAIVFAENFLKTKGAFFFCEDVKDFEISLLSYLSKSDFNQIYIWEKELSEALNGKFPFRKDDTAFENADAGITLCEALVARTGSILVSSGTSAGRRLSVFPHVHIVVAFTSQIVKEVSDGLNLVRRQYGAKLPSMISMVTGPSRTADIEKTLVLGAHGPKELVLFLIDDTSNS